MGIWVAGGCFKAWHHPLVILLMLQGPMQEHSCLNSVSSFKRIFMQHIKTKKLASQVWHTPEIPDLGRWTREFKAGLGWLCEVSHKRTKKRK